MTIAPRLFDNVTPESAVAAAEDEFGPFVARVCLFSGGNDSLTCAHRCREMYDSLVFIDTGTAVPGVREFVEHAAEWLNKPLMVYAAAPDEYRRIVVGGVDGRGRLHEPLGFPGPMAHGSCYNRLKERALEQMRRELKAGDRKARILALTGVRQSESERRRSRTVLNRKGALIFCNPLIDWTPHDLHEYRTAHGLIESDVAALLHRSGECNCGAYAAPGEREELRALWPEWFDATIGSLEREAERMGLAVSRWGSGRETLYADDAGLLCSDCQLRMEVA